MTIFEKKTAELEALQRKIRMSQEALDKAAASAEMAMKRWKKHAQERAAVEAARIGAEAGSRARAQWEAKRIQALALAQA